MNEKNNLGVNNQLPPMGSTVSNSIPNDPNSFSNFNNNINQNIQNNDVSVFDLMNQFSNLNNEKVNQMPENNVSQMPNMGQPMNNPVNQMPENNVSQMPNMGQPINNPVNQIDSPQNNMDNTMQIPRIPQQNGNLVQEELNNNTNNMQSIEDNTPVDLSRPDLVQQSDVFSIGKDSDKNGMIVPPIIVPEDVVSEEVDKDKLINSLMNDISSPKEEEKNNEELSVDNSESNQESVDKPKKKSKKLLLIIIVAAVLLIVIAVLLYFLFFNKNMKSSKSVCSIQSFDDVNNFETVENITLNFKGDKLKSAEIDHNITFHETPEEQKAALLANFRNEYEGRGKEFSSIESDNNVEFIVTYEPEDFKNSFGMDDSNMKKENIISTLKNNGFTCN